MNIVQSICWFSLLSTFGTKYVLGMEGKSCETTPQCPRYQRCIGNKCAFCSKHEDCGSTNLICKNQRCVFCSGKLETCAAKEECCKCPECECIQGYCTDKQPCKEDPDCPSGTVCIRRIGKLHLCYPACTADNTRGRRCIKELGPNYEQCRNGRCRKCIKNGRPCGEYDFCCQSTDVCKDKTCQLRPPNTSCTGKHEKCSNSKYCCYGPCKYFTGSGEACECDRSGDCSGRPDRG